MTGLPKCRVCGAETEAVGGLGDIAISDFTKKPTKGRKYPLNLVFCPDCTLLQLEEITPRELLYKDYWYRSSLNQEIVYDLHNIVKKALGFVYGSSNIWIDIGANDGSLLSYVPSYFYRVAVEPAQTFKKELSKFSDYYQTYWEDVPQKYQATVITAIACMYDLPDPNKFVKKIKDNLYKDGIFIAEFESLPQMIENNDLGFICHEHIEYYSYKSLVRLFEKNGLEIFKVEKNGINGGSYRIYVGHFKKGSIKFKEKEYSAEDIKDFFRRVENNRRQFLGWIEKNKVIGYGASTKANTILQYYGINDGFVVDVNPDKIGKYMVNSTIQIIKEIPPITKNLWVFPWGFLDYFKKKEDYKGKWVVTIPEFKVYDN